jgi:hypothetical protein
VYINNNVYFCTDKPIKKNLMKRLLQVCFIAAMVFGLASCSKDDTKPTGNGTGTGTGEIPTSLVGTTWSWSTDGGGSLQFVSDSMAVVTVNNYHNHGDSLDRSVPKGGVFYGTYTYSNGNGTLWLYIDGRMLEVHFTVSGNTLTATGTPDGDVVMTLVGGNPQPGPQPGGDTNTLKSLVGTQWAFNDGEADVLVLFETTMVKVSVQTPHGPEYYEGTYTYSNGSGTINLTIEGREFNIAFTVSGNTMTAYNTPSGDVTLTLVNSQPGPQPGGNYPLNGTAWQSSFMEDSIYITLTVTFGTTNCNMEMTFADSIPTQYMQGTYTYTGTLTSGQGTITIQDEEGPETAYFTVNGNEATVTSHGESHVFIRTDNGR